MSLRFSPREDFDPEAYGRGSCVLLKGAEDYEGIIKFDTWATGLVRGTHGPASQHDIELTGTGSQLRMRFSALEEVEQWALDRGNHGIMLRPRALADRLQTIALDLVKRYSNEGHAAPGLEQLPGDRIDL